MTPCGSYVVYSDDEIIRCHNLATARYFIRRNEMALKTKKNIRNTRYGMGYTSSEIALMIVTNLSGRSVDDLNLMIEDSGMKKINPSTFELNRRKVNNLLDALSNNHITIGEFQEEISGELDRTRATFDTINILE